MLMLSMALGTGGFVTAKQPCNAHKLSIAAVSAPCASKLAFSLGSSCQASKIQYGQHDVMLMVVMLGQLLTILFLYIAAAIPAAPIQRLFRPPASVI